MRSRRAAAALSAIHAPMELPTMMCWPGRATLSMTWSVSSYLQTALLIGRHAHSHLAACIQGNM